MYGFFVHNNHTYKKMNRLIQNLIETAPLLVKYLQEDIAISISDKENYVYLLETEKLKFPFPVGQAIRTSGYEEVLDRMEKTGQSIINFVPKEVTGTVPIKSIISPIMDGSEVVGFFSVSINFEKEMNVEDVSVRLTDSIGSITESIHDIATSAEVLNERMTSIEHEISCTEETVKAENEAIKLIQGISKQSNLLGLNAAIEAARLGASGSGFAIVATEMRKLAEESKSISERIANSLKAIEESIHHTVSQIREAKGISHEQYMSTDKASKSMDNIKEYSNTLVQYSKN